MGAITKRKEGKNTYYVYQETYRVKIDTKAFAKTKGSGKSKVKTRAIYLGTADKIFSCLKENREPISVKTRHFGLIAAAYQTASEIGLPEILQKHIPGNRGQVPRWIYFLVTILNRLDHATSKNRMSAWLQKTPLPELLGFDPHKLSSKNFWYAADDILSEGELKARREQEEKTDDPWAGLSGDSFSKIEGELFSRIDQLMDLSPGVICYDTTNFYTYIEEPKRSELANTCHSKDSHHHLKHVGLLMAVEKAHGIPLLSRVYQANRHDSKVFSHVLADLIIALKKLCGSQSDLVLVFDKGNNSEDNFHDIPAEISWVGALVPSHYQDLIDLELSAYHGRWKNMLHYRCKRRVMGLECAVVLTFSDKTKRKQVHSLHRRLEKLKSELRTKWAAYKKIPRTIPQGIKSILKKSSLGDCLEVSLVKGQLHFQEQEAQIETRKKRFGKSVIFSNMLQAETGFLIDTYHEKNVIEDDFQLLKDPTIIRFRPIRHWTDTKIRAYAFCCVASMTLMRIMQWKAERAGYKMSPNLLKEELADLQEVVMIYSPTEARRKITQRSSVQNKLWEIFKLEEIEKSCYYTNQN
jgi:transposase